MRIRNERFILFLGEFSGTAERLLTFRRPCTTPIKIAVLLATDHDWVNK